MWKSVSAAVCALVLSGSVQAQELFSRAQTVADLDDVYFIAQLQVDDMEVFQTQYVPPVAEMLAETSALVLAVTPSPMVVEGEWISNWTVLMRFEDQADFDTFYANETYQAQFIPLRTGAASINNIVLLPALNPEQFGQ